MDTYLIESDSSRETNHLLAGLLREHGAVRIYHEHPPRHPNYRELHEFSSGGTAMTTYLRDEGERKAVISLIGFPQDSPMYSELKARLGQLSKKHWVDIEDPVP